MKNDIRFGVKLRLLAEYLPTRALGYVLRLFPRKARRILGRALGRIAFALDARHRAVTLNNLDIAFGDSKTTKEKRVLARGTFQHFGSMLFELFLLGGASQGRIERIVEFGGVEHFERARAAGKGVILVGAHYGNWELHAIAHGYRFGPFSVVARALDNPYFNQWLERIRNTSGNRVVYKQQALTRLLRLLKEGETVGLVVDQNVSLEDCIFIDFFGKKAASTPVASLLSLKTGAMLVPLFATPLPDGRYRCVYDEPIDPREYSDIDRQLATRRMTQQCAEVLERYVRRDPEFWLWMHRRWKTRPAEEPDLIENDTSDQNRPEPR
jgi:KDO2-lipid IV(A) lauroyltransferase